MNPLTKIEHRPWPVPNRPWIMVQVWRDLLFAHWKLEPDAVREFVPKQLQLDTFGGHAWISVTPFHMSVRVRALPPFPGMFDVPELNCRTYVTCEGKPGVFFFSLDIASAMAAWAAKKLYYLPYFRARMRMGPLGGWISYSSVRGTAVWRAAYTPTSSAKFAAVGTLDYFLAERYCLYTVRDGSAYRAEIHHLPWPLQEASAKIEVNTVPSAVGIRVPATPDALAFARELKVLIWPLERIK